jgi:hypothetical protein
MTPTYEPLPAVLRVGDKIACPKHYETPEVLEVVKVRDTGHLLLQRVNGNAVTQQWTRDDMAAFDYKLVTQRPNATKGVPSCPPPERQTSG